MIEKLTDDARRQLRLCSMYGEQALRIIDAQAAVIERVIRIRDALATDETVLCSALDEALAAAPEHTGPGQSREELLDRITKLERHFVPELHDQLDAANAKCDAQAAVIERVRVIVERNRNILWLYLLFTEALAAAPEHTLGHPGADEVFAQLQSRRAAPEHTAPELPSTLFAELSEMREYEEENGTLVLDGATIVRLRERLDAANARMVELGRRLDEALAEVRERAGEASAANARIAELETACREYRGLLKAAYDAERTAEDEVGKLRAEVELQRAAGLEHMRSLSTATELLRQVQASSRGRRWVKRIDAFLSTAPALTEHEAAERKVLEAMAAVPEETLRRSAENATHAPEHSRAPALAELARRAVKP